MDKTGKKVNSIVHIITSLDVTTPAIESLLLTEGNSNSHLIFGYEGVNEKNLIPLALEKNVLGRMKFVPTLNNSATNSENRTSIKSICNLLKEWKPDIVHTHSAEAGIVGGKAAELAGVPVIIHTYYKNGINGNHKKKLKEYLNNKCSRIVVYADNDLQNLRELVSSPNKIVHVSPCLELDNFKNIQIENGDLDIEFGISRNIPVVGFMGLSLSSKEYESFFDIAKLVHEQISNVCFFVIGKDSDRIKFDKLQEKYDAGESIKFAVLTDKVENLYADLDIAVFSSLNANLEVRLIEIMASGCPIIAFDNERIAELVSDKSVLVQSGNNISVSENIVNLVKNKNSAEKIGKSGCEYVLAKYGKTRFLDELFKFTMMNFHPKIFFIRKIHPQKHLP